VSDLSGPSVTAARRSSLAPSTAARTRALLPVAAVVGVGIVCGVVWWWLAPLARADVEGSSVFLRGHQELQAAQDCWFAAVLGALGVLAATVQGWRSGASRTRTGPGRLGGALAGQASRLLLVVVALLLVSLVAWQTGVWLGPPDLASQVAAGSRHPLTPLQLHTAAVLLVGPFFFTFTSFLTALFGGGPSRRA
jgi:hypothetical protein